MIGILLIATRKYKQFIPPLVEQIFRYVLPGEEKNIFLFSDDKLILPKKIEKQLDKIHITEIGVEPYKFPYATLYRYKIFNENAGLVQHCSHLLYLDADSAIVGTVGAEILVDGFMAVRHPGFYSSDLWGSEGNPEKSTSWFPPEQRKHYYCGGTQGGKSEHYLEACKVLRKRIDEDDLNGVKAIHNDETHWNKWCNVDRPELVTEFDSGYCLVESLYLRTQWGLGHLKPRILALDKNHQEIRL